MNDVLDRIARLRVALIGDVMLDRYLSGDVRRISPEAPVPVVQVRQARAVPGGAANVAMNLAGLGATVELIGVAGDDAAGNELVAALAAGQVRCDGIARTGARQTTCKLRIIGAHQQIARVDHEDLTPLSPEREQAMLPVIRDTIDRSDVVIVSDYGKGVCSDAVLSHVFACAAGCGKPVIVDPKRRDFAAYRGATILTPNRQELGEATRLPCENDDEALAAAQAAQAVCGADILLTRSEKGMSLFPVIGPPVHLATSAQDVFDVSGAGDTVVAVLAAGIATGQTMAEAMRLANHAAGIVVSKLGTATVTCGDLLAALADSHDPDEANGPVPIGRAALVALRHRWRGEKLSVGFTNGCFDLLHPGHVSLLAQAARACDRLIVGLNTDASVRQLKGPGRPVQSEFARAQVMAAIKGVAAVTLFDENTPADLIEALQPDVLVKGADYARADVVGADLVEARGGRVLLAALSPGHSTTALVAATQSARLPASRRGSGPD